MVQVFQKPSKKIVNWSSWKEEGGKKLYNNWKIKG